MLFAFLNESLKQHCKTVVVRPLGSHLIKHAIKTINICGALLVKQ